LGSGKRFNAEDAEGRRGKSVTENEIGEAVLGAAMKVHSAVGPGLLESVYETCLTHELRKQGFDVQRQVALPVEYDGQRIDAGFRLDILVAEKVVVEVKAVERTAPIHTAQILTYLKLGGFKLGYLLNFNVVHMRNGIKRLVNDL
jgi:GxxExxY protein